MFRAARLIADDIEYPAVIRNLSAGGVMAEAEAPLKLGMEVRLAIPNFGELEGAVRWIQGARAGILFNEKIEFEAVKNFTRKKKRPATAEGAAAKPPLPAAQQMRSEEHTSELQSLMRISYAVFC